MIGISPGAIGAPRSIMFLMLNSHSPRESLARVMCCASWQVAHRAVVRSEPLPGISVFEGSGSCATEGAIRVPRVTASNTAPIQTSDGGAFRIDIMTSTLLRFYDETHAVNTVPEVA